MSSAEAGHNSAAEEAASRASVMAFVLMYVMRWLRLVQGEDSNTAPRSKVQILLLTRPLLVQSGDHDDAQQCPLLGVKRTLHRHALMSTFDPKRTLTAITP